MADVDTFDASRLSRRSSTTTTSLDTEVALKLFSGTSVDLETQESSILPAVPEHEEYDTSPSGVPGDGGPVQATPAQGSLSRVQSISAGGMTLSRMSSLKMAPQVADAWTNAGAYLRGSWQYQKTQRAAAAAVLSEYGAVNIEHGGVQGIKAHVESLISEHKLNDTVYLYDLGNVYRMWRAWQAAMPRVKPYYAVKCNPEPAILRMLLALGAGFDCASQSELAAVLAIGEPVSRIIFANPCKRSSDIEFAAQHGVQATTFDTVSELEKIAASGPKIGCVLRIRADDPEARVQLGLKYGADPSDVLDLLQAAKKLDLKVCGVSFHVGSGAKNLAVFRDAIMAARHVFDMAELMGFHMELLDIGGGFTGHFNDAGEVLFGDIASAINDALEEQFPEHMGVRVIAEPGRYFAETSATLLTPIYGQRARTTAAPGQEPSHDYWITDGLYGSFNCALYDSQNLDFRVVRSPLLPAPPQPEVTARSTVWGPTCDSADCVYKDIQLPLLRNGDWLMFPNAGAYTVAGACDFNGINMTQPKKFYVFSDSAVDGPADKLAQSCSAHALLAEARPRASKGSEVQAVHCGAACLADAGAPQPDGRSAVILDKLQVPTCTVFAP